MSSLIEYTLYFLLTCLVISVACTLVREPDWRRAGRDVSHLFILCCLGILLICAVVHALEWAFIL